VPGADVTNTSFHVAITLVIEAADNRYSHEGEEEKTQTKNFKSASRFVKNFFARPIHHSLHRS
jgi:hypothetical protein